MKRLFAVDVARGVEALDADVVQVRRPVHGGAGVGLGDHQGALFAGLPPAGLGEVLDLAGVAARAEQAEAAVLAQFQDILAGFVDEVVLAVAEEGEVPVVEPAQQILGLAQLGNLRRVGHLVQVLRQSAGPCCASSASLRRRRGRRRGPVPAL